MVGKQRHDTCLNLCLEFQQNLSHRFRASLSDTFWQHMDRQTIQNRARSSSSVTIPFHCGLGLKSTEAVGGNNPMSYWKIHQLADCSSSDGKFRKVPFLCLFCFVSSFLRSKYRSRDKTRAQTWAISGKMTIILATSDNFLQQHVLDNEAFSDRMKMSGYQLPTSIIIPPWRWNEAKGWTLSLDV